MTALNNPIRWEKYFDDDDNSVWEASGPYGDEEGGCLGSWRLKQFLTHDRIIWVEDHDAELRDEFNVMQSWPTLEAAKKEIENAHQQILEEYDL